MEFIVEATEVQEDSSLANITDCSETPNLEKKSIYRILSSHDNKFEPIALHEQQSTQTGPLHQAQKLEKYNERAQNFKLIHDLEAQTQVKQSQKSVDLRRSIKKRNKTKLKYSEQIGHKQTDTFEVQPESEKIDLIGQVNSADAEDNSPGLEPSTFRPTGLHKTLSAFKNPKNKASRSLSSRHETQPKEKLVFHITLYESIPSYSENLPRLQRTGKVIDQKTDNSD